nr:immunoglobulin light chain junction region [Macaca mulatta]MOV72439.1 immunoglobulin light chain junction region [Macaca mulatta]MOV72749.1 immunoglobulin light chain junction region [Macaca mulatta]MOV73205.1 immunoglobulin light chain junction region [Macaca mulatta]MOV73323.1 immunoglobulin light chain junction region [Macaca mulatta]
DYYCQVYDGSAWVF